MKRTTLASSVLFTSLALVACDPEPHDADLSEDSAAGKADEASSSFDADPRSSAFEEDDGVYVETQYRWPVETSQSNAKEDGLEGRELPICVTEAGRDEALIWSQARVIAADALRTACVETAKRTVERLAEAHGGVQNIPSDQLPCGVEAKYGFNPEAALAVCSEAAFMSEGEKEFEAFVTVAGELGYDGRIETDELLDESEDVLEHGRNFYANASVGFELKWNLNPSPGNPRGCAMPEFLTMFEPMVTATVTRMQEAHEFAWCRVPSEDET